MSKDGEKRKFVFIFCFFCLTLHHQQQQSQLWMVKILFVGKVI